MATSVFCIASSETKANDIVTRLKASGFGDNDISVLFPDRRSTHAFAHERHTKAPEGAVAGAGTGGLVGGTIGLLAGVGLLAIPGVGPFLAAGPIFAALSGVAAGAAVGGIAGALVGMGIPEIEARRYEGSVKDGNILISAHSTSAEQIRKAKTIFESAGASDIGSGPEAHSAFKGRAVENAGPRELGALGAVGVAPAVARPAPAPMAPPPVPVEAARMTPDWPARAEPGQCWERVYIPPKTEQVSERIMVHEPIEKLEIVPARFEWVDEQHLVKDACTELKEVPAQYKTVETTLEVEPASTSWVTGGQHRHGEDGESGVYCLVRQPPVMKTIQQRVLAEPPKVVETPVPAQYTTVRRQKLVAPATTKKTVVPAVYDTVQKTMVVTPGRWEWQQVVCDAQIPNANNAVKAALAKAGYKTGALNGEMEIEDWNALRAFQYKHQLGVGGLTYETLKTLGVSIENIPAGAGEFKKAAESVKKVAAAVTPGRLAETAKKAVTTAPETARTAARV